MKVRTGFISNSSSTSFVVIGNGNLSSKEEFIKHFCQGQELIIGSRIGETEFGWGPDELYGIGDRINFAYLRALLCEDSKEKLLLLEKVIKDYTNIQIISCNLRNSYNDSEEDNNNDFDYGYIDHQSVEDSKNLEMFESEEQLKNFLFSKNSYIVLDNDNH